jgi:hypothetical protein
VISNSFPQLVPLCGRTPKKTGEAVPRKIGTSIEMACTAFPVNGIGAANPAYRIGRFTPDAVYLPDVRHTCHRYTRNYLLSTSRFAFSITGLFIPNKVRDRLFSSTVLTYRDHCPRFSLPLTTYWFPRYAAQGLTVSVAEL